MLNFKLCLEKIGTALCIESNDISELFCTYEAALENGYLKGDLIDNRTGEVLAYFYYDIRNGGQDFHHYISDVLNGLW